MNYLSHLSLFIFPLSSTLEEIAIDFVIPLREKKHTHRQLAREVFPELYDKIRHLREDLIVATEPSVISHPFGTSFGPSPFFLINPELMKEMPEGAKFFSHRAAYQIHHNHNLKSSALALTVSGIFLGMVIFFQPSLPLWAPFASIPLSFIINKKVHSTAQFYFSEKAHAEAIAKASEAELDQARICIEAQMSANREVWRVNPDGEFSQEGDRKKSLCWENITIPLSQQLKMITGLRRRALLNGQEEFRVKSSLKGMHQSIHYKLKYN